MTDQLVWVPCKKIIPNRFQPRKDFKAKELEELAESIDQQGLIQPIIVRKVDDLPDGFEYELVAGERRWRATMDILGKDKIRAIIRDIADGASQEAAITENLQREDLNPLEEAKAVLQLMEFNSLTQEQVAKRLGKSRSYIANIIRLTRLNNNVIQMVASGLLDRSKAISLLAVTDEAQQSNLAKVAVAKNWTVEKLKSEIEKIVATRDPNTANAIVTRENDGHTTLVAMPSRSHRRKFKQNVNTENFVLIEFDTDIDAQSFIKYMSEQKRKCWKGRDAINQLDQLKKLVNNESPITEE